MRMFRDECWHCNLYDDEKTAKNGDPFCKKSGRLNMEKETTKKCKDFIKYIESPANKKEK